MSTSIKTKNKQTKVPADVLTVIELNLYIDLRTMNTSTVFGLPIHDHKSLSTYFSFLSILLVFFSLWQTDPELISLCENLNISFITGTLILSDSVLNLGLQLFMA